MGELLQGQFGEARRPRYREAIEDAQLNEFWRQAIDPEALCLDVEAQEAVEGLTGEQVVADLRSNYNLTSNEALTIYEGVQAIVGLSRLVRSPVTTNRSRRRTSRVYAH